MINVDNDSAENDNVNHDNLNVENNNVDKIVKKITRLKEKLKKRNT